MYESFLTYGLTDIDEIGMHIKQVSTIAHCAINKKGVPIFDMVKAAYVRDNKVN